MRFLVGVDLGQAQDPTALAVLEQVPETDSIMRYDLRHLHRFPLGTPYPAIVTHTQDLLTRPPLGGASDLVVDATGVGMPVVDLLRQAGLNPVAVTITGGFTSTQDDLRRWRVPKRDLVSTLQMLLQAGRLRIAEALPDAPRLVRELLAVRVRITPEAHDTYGSWREGAHDDLVLALALACWYGEWGEKRYGRDYGIL